MQLNHSGRKGGGTSAGEPGTSVWCLPRLAVCLPPVPVHCGMDATWGLAPNSRPIFCTAVTKQTALGERWGRCRVVGSPSIPHAPAWRAVKKEEGRGLGVTAATWHTQPFASNKSYAFFCCCFLTECFLKIILFLSS